MNHLNQLQFNGDNYQNGQKQSECVETLEVYKQDNGRQQHKGQYKGYSSCLNQILESFRHLLNESNPHIDSSIVKEKITYLFTPYIHNLTEEDTRLIIKVLREIFYLNKGIKKKLFYVRIIHHLLANYSIFSNSLLPFLPQMLRNAVRTAYIEEKVYTVTEFKCFFRIWSAFLSQQCLQSIKTLVLLEEKCDLSDLEPNNKLLFSIVKLTPLSKQHRSHILPPVEAMQIFKPKQFNLKNKNYSKFNPNLMINWNHRNKYHNNSNYKKPYPTYFKPETFDLLNKDETQTTNLHSDLKDEQLRLFDFDMLETLEVPLQSHEISLYLSIYIRIKEGQKDKGNSLLKLKNMKDGLMKKKRERGWQVLLVHGRFENNWKFRQNGDLMIDNAVKVEEYLGICKQYRRQERQYNRNYVQLFDHGDDSLLDCHQCKFCNGLLPVTTIDNQKLITNAIIFKFLDKYIPSSTNAPIFRCNIDQDDIIFGIYLLHIECLHYILQDNFNRSLQQRPQR